MGAVQLACSSLTFNALPLDEACRRVRALGFTAIDLGMFDQPGLGHVTPAETAEHLLEVEERIQAATAAAGVTVAAIAADADAGDPQEGQRRMAAVGLMAHRLGARALTVMVGDATVDEAVAQLAPVHEVGVRYGVVVAVETVSGTITGRPKAAAELLARIPGLRLTLDPSHLVVQGQTLEDWRHLMASVAHVHLRDAGPGNREKLQVPWGSGGVKLAELLRLLDAGDYEGWITVEYADPVLLPGTVTDAPAEARKAREALLAALGGPA